MQIQFILALNALQKQLQVTGLSYFSILQQFFLKILPSYLSVFIGFVVLESNFRMQRGEAFASASPQHI